MAKVTIQLRRDGPYWVSGTVELVDAEGRCFELRDQTFALCRCGGSTTKPFCDGTHSKLGFRSAEAAVAREEAGDDALKLP